MTRITRLRPAHVEFMPEEMEPGVIYISERYKTAMHLCCCGCGSEVVTPLNPAKWRLTEHAGDVSLYPSVGNWSLPCQSHYWIERGKVCWSYAFSPAQIRAVQDCDFEDAVRAASQTPSPPSRPVRKGLFRSLYDLFTGWIDRLRK